MNKEDLYNTIENYNKIFKSQTNISYFDFKPNIKLLLKLYNGKIIHSDITNESLIFLDNLLNKVFNTILVRKIENPVYTYKVDEKILNKLNYPKTINKKISIYLFEMLYDIFEICSIDSAYFENNEKGILGKDKDTITPEIILEQLQFIPLSDKKFISSIIANNKIIF